MVGLDRIRFEESGDLYSHEVSKMLQEFSNIYMVGLDSMHFGDSWYLYSHAVSKNSQILMTGLY